MNVNIPFILAKEHCQDKTFRVAFYFPFRRKELSLKRDTWIRISKSFLEKVYNITRKF